MSDLRELYQQVILDHYRAPRNYRTLDDATGHADGHNPLCGDRVRVQLRVGGGTIEDVCFEGAGCAISTASASLMTEAVKGKTVDEARGLFGSFRALVMGEQASGPAVELGKLEVLAGVREYPVRVKCATLAWHTLEAALETGTDGSAGSEQGSEASSAPITTE